MQPAATRSKEMATAFTRRKRTSYNVGSMARKLANLALSTQAMQRPSADKQTSKAPQHNGIIMAMRQTYAARQW
jgi:hypothetical protein